MKKNIFLFLSLASFVATAQTNIETPVRKNVITFNIIAFPSIQYERFISERRSFSIGGVANFFPLATGALSTIADFRFYIKPKRQDYDGSTKHSFFGPFIKYTNRTGSFTNDLALNIDHQLGFGFCFGVQNISAKGFVMGILGGVGPSVLMINNGFTETWFDDPSSVIVRCSLFIGFAK